jgi:hypothetical protein
MNSSIKIIILIFICIILIYHLIESKENWVPWVWNIPTRDIYPRLYYDYRCSPPVTHYYKPRPIIVKSTLPRDIKFTGFLDYNPYDEYGMYSRYTYLDYPDPRNPYDCRL